MPRVREFRISVARWGAGFLLALTRAIAPTFLVFGMAENRRPFLLCSKQDSSATYFVRIRGDDFEYFRKLHWSKNQSGHYLRTRGGKFVSVFVGDSLTQQGTLRGRNFVSGTYFVSGARPSDSRTASWTAGRTAAILSLSRVG